MRNRVPNLPVGVELVAGDQDQVVGLIERRREVSAGHRRLDRSQHAAAVDVADRARRLLGARQRVRDPAEEVARDLVAQQELHAVAAPLPGVEEVRARIGHRQVVAPLVVERRVERDRVGEALLEAEVVLVGPDRLEAWVAVLRVQYLRLLRLVEDADAGLERERRRHRPVRDDARIVGEVIGAVVVEPVAADAGHDAQVLRRIPQRLEVQRVARVGELVVDVDQVRLRASERAGLVRNRDVEAQILEPQLPVVAGHQRELAVDLLAEIFTQADDLRAGVDVDRAEAESDWSRSRTTARASTTQPSLVTVQVATARWKPMCVPRSRLPRAGSASRHVQGVVAAEHEQRQLARVAQLLGEAGLVVPVDRRRDHVVEPCCFGMTSGSH